MSHFPAKQQYSDSLFFFAYGPETLWADSVRVLFVTLRQGWAMGLKSHGIGVPDWFSSAGTGTQNPATWDSIISWNWLSPTGHKLIQRNNYNDLNVSFSLKVGWKWAEGWFYLRVWPLSNFYWKIRGAAETALEFAGICRSHSCLIFGFV